LAARERFELDAGLDPTPHHKDKDPYLGAVFGERFNDFVVGEIVAVDESACGISTESVFGIIEILVNRDRVDVTVALDENDVGEGGGS
jgi:hypothetical protein